MQPTRSSTEELKEIILRINDILNGHELNSVLVCNPDTNCDFEETVVLPAKPNKPEESYAYNHLDYYEVRWGNSPHRIKPGGTRIMPAFLARHYAKHLANHILQKMEETTGRKGLVQSPTERPKVLGSILLKVQDYFLQEPESPEGEKVAQMVEGMNKPTTKFTQKGDSLNLSELNMGTIPNPVLGVLKPEPKSRQEIMANAGLEEKPKSDLDPIKFNKDGSARTKKDLLDDAIKLGIDVTGKESNDKLVEMIKSF